MAKVSDASERIALKAESPHLPSPAQSQIDGTQFYFGDPTSLDDDLIKLLPPWWKRYVIAAACFLIHLAIGNVLSFGNISPYFASFMTYQTYKIDPTIDLSATYSANVDSSQYIFAAGIGCASVGSLIGGPMETYFGSRKSVLFSCLLYTLGTAVTYFTCGSVLWSIITYGICGGLSSGIAYSICLVTAVRWFPEAQGLMTGLILAAYGAGGMIFTQVQTHYVNPDNAAISVEIGYLEIPKVLHRIPLMFLVMAAIFFGMQLMAVYICDPPRNYLEMQIARYSQMGEGSASKTQLSLRSYASSQSTLSYSPKAVCQSFRFWHIEIISVLDFLAIFFAIQSWKLFSVEYVGITDDNFLASLGSMGALFAAIGRLFWGWAYDVLNKNYRIATLLLSGIQTVAMVTFPLIPSMGKGNETVLRILLSIWVAIMFFCNGYFSFIPSTMAALFGEKHATTFVGFVLMAQIPATFLVSFLCGQIDWIGGWGRAMVWMGGVAFLSWVLTLLFSPTGGGFASESRALLKLGLCNCLERYTPFFKSRRRVMSHSASVHSSHTPDLNQENLVTAETETDNLSHANNSNYQSIGKVVQVVKK